MNKPIALLTDFGTRDWFVASMKGVILAINPAAVIVDVSHEIPPGDIAAAAFNLLACHASFPHGAVFVAVVDPGVGSGREALAVKAGGYFFVGPDNGIFSLILDKYDEAEVRALRDQRYFRKPVSATFHGRDVFAPVAAHLSRGVAFARLGPRFAGPLGLSFPPVRAAEKRLRGSVAYIDRFGNAVTTIPSEAARSARRVIVKGRRIPFAASYAGVKTGRPVAVVGSCGFVEIAVRDGSASRMLRLSVGDQLSAS